MATVFTTHRKVRFIAASARGRGNGERLCWRNRAFRGSSFESSEKSGNRERLVAPLSIFRHLSRISTVASVVVKPKKLEFGGMQVAGGVLLSSAVLSVAPVQRVAGILLVALCLSISVSGYARCLYLSRNEERALDVVLNAHEVARDAYSFTLLSRQRFGWHHFLLSPFYEPSPIYMLLNCWGIYAVGQSTLCSVVGGLKLLYLCGASFALGRFLQAVLVQTANIKHSSHAEQRVDEKLGAQARLVELFFLPNGTWGFGPILNTLIWFSCFSFPYLLYPATPTGMTAPICTAVGIPALLLLEDLYSIFNSSRKAEKIKLGSTPGLQLASLVVGICGACLIR